MPTTSINQRVKRIVDLADDEVQAIEDATGAVNEEDLRYLRFEDFPNVVPLLKRRKLQVLIKFLEQGKALNAMITMDQVQVEANTAGTLAAVQPSVGNRNVPDPTRGAPKVHTDMLSNFSGDAVDYEEWERKSASTIKQTVYGEFLQGPAPVNDLIKTTRSKELFNMILSCVADGHALNTIEKVRDDNNGSECGYSAWKALKDWYLNPNQKDSMISHWEGKLTALYLDKDTTATEYINNFEMYVRKLTKLGETWSDDKKVREFKENVDDPDYDTEVRVHDGDFEQLVWQS